MSITKVIPVIILLAIFSCAKEIPKTNEIKEFIPHKMETKYFYLVTGKKRQLITDFKEVSPGKFHVWVAGGMDYYCTTDNIQFLLPTTTWRK